MDPFEITCQAADRTVRTPWKFAAAPARAARMARVEPGATGYEVVFEAPLVRLRRYESPGGEDAARLDTERRHPIVIAYPFINEPSILDYRPDRSVISGFLERGFPVYVLEWVDASPPRSIRRIGRRRRPIARAVRRVRTRG